MRPKLSVIIPAKNERDTLPRQLAALEAQQYGGMEWVLLNDGSTDGTFRVVHEARSHFADVVKYHHPESWGALPTLNQGAMEARGDWLYLSSANDVVQPGAFQAWHQAVADWPEAVLACGHPQGLSPDWGHEPTFYPPGPLLAQRLGRPHILHGCAVFVRRGVFLAMGGFDPALEWLADFYLWHTLALRHGVLWLAAPIAAVDRSPGRMSEGYRDPERLAPVRRRLSTLLNSSPEAPAWHMGGLLDIPEVQGVTHGNGYESPNFVRGLAAARARSPSGGGEGRPAGVAGPDDGAGARVGADSDPGADL